VRLVTLTMKILNGITDMNQRDTGLLEFIYYRLLNTYKEKPDIDYMLRLGTLAGVNKVLHPDYEVDVTLQQYKAIEETVKSVLKDKASMLFLGGAYDLDFTETREVLEDGLVKHTLKFSEGSVVVAYSKLTEYLSIIMTGAVDISEADSLLESIRYKRSTSKTHCNNPHSPFLSQSNTLYR